jgi:hypothetical protein
VLSVRDQDRWRWAGLEDLDDLSGAHPGDDRHSDGTERAQAVGDHPGTGRSGGLPPWQALGGDRPQAERYPPVVSADIDHRLNA